MAITNQYQLNYTKPKKSSSFGISFIHIAIFLSNMGSAIQESILFHVITKKQCLVLENSQTSQLGLTWKLFLSQKRLV